MSLLNNDYLLLVMGTNSIMSIKIDDLNQQSTRTTADQRLIHVSVDLSWKTKVEYSTHRWVSEDVEQIHQIQKVAV